MMNQSSLQVAFPQVEVNSDVQFTNESFFFFNHSFEPNWAKPSDQQMSKDLQVTQSKLI